MEFALGFVLCIVVVIGLAWCYKRYRKARKAGMTRGAAVKAMVGGGGGPQEP